MTWTAYFQANGEHRHVIGTYRFKHTAEFEAEQFIKRMTNPEVGLWWVWVEDSDADILVRLLDSNSDFHYHGAERDDCNPAADDQGNGI